VAEAVQVPVRADRADQSCYRFESGNAGLCARVIFLSRSFSKVCALMHFAARRATNTA
jgi:hypothetical protein